MINRDLKVEKSVLIQSSKEKVWDALVNPSKIKVYLFGTQTITDWKVGGPIIFQGQYEGKTYRDRGNVIVNHECSLLKYNYWSGFSGLADEPQNYCIVTYSLEAKSDGFVELTWMQEGFASEDGKCHLENSLEAMLMEIKKLVEKG